jgi:hypothetical protein
MLISSESPKWSRPFRVTDLNLHGPSISPMRPTYSAALFCLSYNSHIICRRTNYEASLYVTFFSPISNVLCPNILPTTMFLHVLKLYSSCLVRSHVFHQHKQVHLQQLCVMHSVAPQRRFEQLKQRVTKEKKYLRCQGRA